MNLGNTHATWAQLTNWRQQLRSFGHWPASGATCEAAPTACNPPPIHVIVRGKADDDRDLLIALDYISRGMRAHDEPSSDLGHRHHIDLVRVPSSIRPHVTCGRDRSGLALAGEGIMATDFSDIIVACENANQLNIQGVNDLRGGNLQGALDSFTQGITLIKDLPGEPLVKNLGAALFGNFAQLYMRLGKPDEAIPLLEHQVKLAEEVGDRKSYSNAINNLGICLMQRGDDKDAETMFEKRLEIAKEIDDPQGEGNTLNNLATIYMDRKQYGPARKLLQRRIDLARSINDRRGEASGLMNLGRIHQWLSQAADARKVLQQALALMQADSDPRASQVQDMLAKL